MTFHKYLGDSKMFEYDKYYRECKKLNKPFIKARINSRNRNYYVQIDLMTCNYELSNQGQEEIKNHLDERIDAVERDRKRIREMFPDITKEEWDANTN